MAAAAILTRTSITELIMPMARRIRVCATVARAQCAAARFDDERFQENVNIYQHA